MKLIDDGVPSSTLSSLGWLQIPVSLWHVLVILGHHLNCLAFSFPICKMEYIIVVAFTAHRTSAKFCIKHLAHSWVHSKYQGYECFCSWGLKKRTFYWSLSEDDPILCLYLLWLVFLLAAQGFIAWEVVGVCLLPTESRVPRLRSRFGAIVGVFQPLFQVSRLTDVLQ